MTVFVPLEMSDSADKSAVLRHFHAGRFSVGDLATGSSGIKMGDGSTVYVDKDHYCYSKIVGVGKEGQGADQEILVVMADVKTDNGFIHVIQKQITK